MKHTGHLLIHGGTVLPLAGGRQAEPADVLVQSDEIIAVGRNLAVPADAEFVDAGDALVVPGFIQSHVHVVQSLARHRAEGLQLLPWLRGRIWPYEAALAPAEVGAAASLGIAELLLGGTTAVLDMGTTHDQDQVFTAAQGLGIRFTSGKTHMDSGAGVPADLLEDTGESLLEAERLAARWHGAAAGLLRYAVAPRFILSCSPELLTGCVRLARANGYLLHTH
ncbi:MAG: amidohydrolase family protein, partial [Acidobacteria bacterium]|nr:amidohydrolase family protein [Acidobacteriota bacterium]